MKLTTFASAAWEKKGEVARRERFLGEMDAAIRSNSFDQLAEDSLYDIESISG